MVPYRLKPASNATIATIGRLSTKKIMKGGAQRTMGTFKEASVVSKNKEKWFFPCA
jgi:hypothetical protein